MIRAVIHYCPVYATLLIHIAYSGPGVLYESEYTTSVQPVYVEMRYERVELE